MMNASIPTRTDQLIRHDRQHERRSWTRQTPAAIITMSGGMAEDFSGSESESEDTQVPDVGSHLAEDLGILNAGLKEGSGVNTLTSSGVGDGQIDRVRALDLRIQRLSLNLNEQLNCDHNLNRSSVGVVPQVSCIEREERFNPFDRDMHMEEGHYDNSPVKSSGNTETMNCPQNSHKAVGDSLSETDSLFSEPEERVMDTSLEVIAEMGMAEDHFSLPEGTFDMSTAEELEMEIQNCKALIKESLEPSDRRKNLVHKLIQLRMKLIETKEGPVEEEEDIKHVVGHRFKRRESTGSKHYCEKCASVIWGVLNAWYKCTACGFCCHEKCLNLIYRTCANLKVKENPNYILSICPEKGLDSQNYRCAECSTALSFIAGLEQARRCDYTGAYYCRRCHWNDVMVLPARVVHNWDLEPRKVCRASKQFLRLMGDRACLRIQDINPTLFSLVEELNDVKKLREEILIMKKYFLSCQDALSSKLLLQLTSRQHFVENSDIYSLHDLMDVATDQLLPQLAKIHSSFAQHIKTDCQLCQAKGYMCELCDMKEVLFPFDNIAVVCDRCSTVLHRHCFLHRNRVCPKCERMSRRAAQFTEPPEGAPPPIT